MMSDSPVQFSSKCLAECSPPGDRYARVRFTMTALVLALLMACLQMTYSSAAVAQEVDATAAAQRININTADALALAAALKGVGASKAQEIIRHRETYGPFASTEELLEVKGIGKSTLERNRGVITLE